MTFFTLKKQISFTFFILGIVSCGFHLKGFNTASQNDEGYESLTRKLSKSALILPDEWKQKAKNNFGLELLTQEPKCQPCEKTIILLDSVYQKDILSLNSAGRVREYRLKYLVNYTNHNNYSNNQKNQKKLSIYRDMTFNDATILAKQEEERLLKEDMEREIFDVLINQL